MRSTILIYRKVAIVTGELSAVPSPNHLSLSQCGDHCPNDFECRGEERSFQKPSGRVYRDMPVI